MYANEETILVVGHPAADTPGCHQTNQGQTTQESPSWIPDSQIKWLFTPLSFSNSLLCSERFSSPVYLYNAIALSVLITDLESVLFLDYQKIGMRHVVFSFIVFIFWRGVFWKRRDGEKEHIIMKRYSVTK